MRIKDLFFDLKHPKTLNRLYKAYYGWKFFAEEYSGSFDISLSKKNSCRIETLIELDDANRVRSFSFRKVITAMTFEVSIALSLLFYSL